MVLNRSYKLQMSPNPNPNANHIPKTIPNFNLTQYVR